MSAFVRCRRLLNQSAKALIESKIQELGVGSQFRVLFDRIEIRRIFHKCRFDEKKCTAGIEALGFYHERKDEQRSVGLGPSHDWSSHAADAFGLMALSYEDPQRIANFRKPIVFPKQAMV